MVLITIVTGAYKPTYNWGTSHCTFLFHWFKVTVFRKQNWALNCIAVSLTSPRCIPFSFFQALQGNMAIEKACAMSSFGADFKGFMKRWAIWGWRGKLEAVRYHVTICNECWKNINHKAIVKTKTKRICGNFIIGNICYYSEIASDTLQGLRICYQPLGQHILVMTTTHPFWIYVWDNIIYPYTMSYIYIYI